MRRNYVVEEWEYQQQRGWQGSEAQRYFLHEKGNGTGIEGECLLFIYHGCSQQLPKESPSQQWKLLWLQTTLNSVSPVPKMFPRYKQIKHIKDKYATKSPIDGS